MALFTDGNISQLEDLAAQDSSVLDVANSEGIDLTRKLELAQAEIGMELAEVLGRLGGGSEANVVLTAPLKLWHTFRTLELTYRDGYYNQLNDRYRARRDEYRDLARWAKEKMWQGGIGLTDDAIGRAARLELRAAPGGVPAGTYFVTVCWVGRTGQEGSPAPAHSIELEAAGGFVVRPLEAPGNAVGWNVYAGEAEEEMRLQNPAVLTLSEEWTQSMGLRTDGRRPGNGPEARWYRTAPRMIQRG